MVVKLVEHIDKYIDDHKQELEKMKKIQEEAAANGIVSKQIDAGWSGTSTPPAK